MPLPKHAKVASLVSQSFFSLFFSFVTLCMNEDAAWYAAAANNMAGLYNALCGFYFAALEQTVKDFHFVPSGT
jgi:hypothetical protein